MWSSGAATTTYWFLQFRRQQVCGDFHVKFRRFLPCRRGKLIASPHYDSEASAEAIFLGLRNRCRVTCSDDAQWPIKIRFSFSDKNVSRCARQLPRSIEG